MKKETLRFYNPQTRTWSIRLEELTMMQIEALEELLNIKTRSPN